MRLKKGRSSEYIDGTSRRYIQLNMLQAQAHLLFLSQRPTGGRREGEGIKDTPCQPEKSHFCRLISAGYPLA